MQMRLPTHKILTYFHTHIYSQFISTEKHYFYPIQIFISYNICTIQILRPKFTSTLSGSDARGASSKYTGKLYCVGAVVCKPRRGVDWGMKNRAALEAKGRKQWLFAAGKVLPPTPVGTTFKERPG